MRKRFNKILSELTSMILIRNAIICSNPIKYLRDAEKELIEVKKLINEIVYTLSPEYIYDFTKANTTLDHSNDLQGKEMIANHKVLNIIKEYLKS